MPRAPRIVFENIPYHVTQRGNRREQVFFSAADYRTYLRWLREYTDKHRVGVLAYCLMPNHVHLVMVPSTPDGLCRTLKPLHMRYAQRFNRAREITGHVWQRRFFSAPLEGSHLVATIRYVELNPIRAGLTQHAEVFRWSSAAAHCGLRRDRILATTGPWSDIITLLGDWSAWLSEGDGSR